MAGMVALRQSFLWGEVTQVSGTARKERTLDRGLQWRL